VNKEFFRNMRSELPAIFAFALVFLFGGIFSTWFNNLLNIKFVNLFAIFCWISFIYLMTLGIFLFILNKSKFIELSGGYIRFYYGRPWSKKFIAIPLDNFDSADISESPREFLSWSAFAPPMKYKEGHNVIKINFSLALPNGVIEEIREIKRKAFTPPTVFINEKGSKVFIRAELKGGYHPFLEQLNRR